MNVVIDRNNTCISFSCPSSRARFLASNAVVPQDQPGEDGVIPPHVIVTGYLLFHRSIVGDLLMGSLRDVTYTN